MFNLHRLYAVVLSAALCVTLAACSTQQGKVVAKPASQVRQSAKPKFPKVQLSEKLLYDILLGEIAGRRGQLEVSVQALSRAAALSRDPRLAERATLAAIYSKRHIEAKRNARLWVELLPSSIDARSALGIVMLETNNISASIGQFKKVLAIANKRGLLRRRFIRIASILGHRHNRKVGLQVMRALVTAYPREAAAQYALAHLAVRVGDLDVGLEAINKAIKLRSQWPDAAQFKARILVSRKNPLMIQQFFEQYLSRHPKANRLRESYARYFVEKKQWLQALKHFKGVVRHIDNPKSLLYKRSVFATGLLSIQTSDYTQAKKYLLLTLKTSPDNDQARLYLGQVAERQGKYPEAAGWYGKILDKRYVFEAQVRFGVMLAKQGNIVAARDHLRNIKPNTDQERVKLVLAEEQLFRDEKKYKEAYTVLTNALKLLPKNKDLLYSRALVAEKLDKLDVHEKDIREILKQEPDNAHALNALGYTLADKTTRYKEALTLITKALTLRPNDAFILDSMGWLHYRMGNIKLALKYLRKALSIRSDAEISAHLGEVLWHQGRHGEARSVWSNALKVTPNNDALADVVKKYKQ